MSDFAIFCCSKNNYTACKKQKRFSLVNINEYPISRKVVYIYYGNTVSGEISLTLSNIAELPYTLPAPLSWWLWINNPDKSLSSFLIKTHSAKNCLSFQWNSFRKSILFFQKETSLKLALWQNTYNNYFFRKISLQEPSLSTKWNKVRSYSVLVC